MDVIKTLLEADLFQSEKTIQRYEYLKIKDETDTNIYFIENGSVRIFIMDEDEERIIRFGYSGNIIVSLDSFLSGRSSDFYIQAIKNTSVKIASQKDFNEFMRSNPENMKLWINILEDLVLQQIEREKDLLINSPRE